MEATYRVLLLLMWGLYLLCFFPFLLTSPIYLALFITAIAGFAVAIAGLLRHSLNARASLLISLFYLAIYAISIVGPSFFSSSDVTGDSIGVSISKFYRGSAMLLRARLDSSDIWTALTIAYAQFIMPALVFIAVLAFALRGRQGTRPSPV